MIGFDCTAVHTHKGLTYMKEGRDALVWREKNWRDQILVAFSDDSNTKVQRKGMIHLVKGRFLVK